MDFTTLSRLGPWIKVIREGDNLSRKREKNKGAHHLTLRNDFESGIPDECWCIVYHYTILLSYWTYGLRLIAFHICPNSQVQRRG